MREAKKIFAVRGRVEKIAGDAAAASRLSRFGEQRALFKHQIAKCRV